MIRRRHIFYVEGYDPQGPEGYCRLFRREFKRFLVTWPVRAEVSGPSLDSEHLAHWDIAAEGPNWKTSTRYEFLRLESFLRGNLAQPLWRQLARAAKWQLDDLLTGTSFRIFRASWWFAVHLIYPQLMILLWLAVAAGGGWLAAVLAGRAGLPAPAAWPIAPVAAVALFYALRPLAERWFVLRISNGWPYIREFASGKPSGYSGPIESYAERIVAAARENQSDEIVIIGHSAGGGVSVAVLARALELDPELGRRGPRLVLLTLGSLLPAFTLHPRAERIRGAMRRLAAEPSLLWVDCQSRKDWLNFWNFDPLDAASVRREERRCTLAIWHIRFRDMLKAEAYGRLQWNLFRMHFQFIMANDMRAPYDYFMLVCGPVSVADWANDGKGVLAAFDQDAAYREPHAAGATAAAM